MTLVGRWPAPCTGGSAGLGGVAASGVISTRVFFFGSAKSSSPSTMRRFSFISSPADRDDEVRLVVELLDAHGYQLPEVGWQRLERRRGQLLLNGRGGLELDLEIGDPKVDIPGRKQIRSGLLLLDRPAGRDRIQRALRVVDLPLNHVAELDDNIHERHACRPVVSDAKIVLDVRMENRRQRDAVRLSPRILES